MTYIGDIKAAAESAVTASPYMADVRDVLVEPAVGADGQDILLITVVLADSRFADIDGTDLIRTLVAIKTSVRDTGEDRQAVVSYRSETDMDADGDPES